jgi:hypothetical protein
LWYEANGRANTRKSIERQRLEREQQGDVVEVEVDLTDINNLFSERGQGPHMLEMEFEPTTATAEEYVSRRTGKLTQRWAWKHKLTKNNVQRYRTKSGKSFDTGVLSHYLKMITEVDDRVAFIRAQRILELNGTKSRTVVEAMKDPTRIVSREVLLKQWVSGDLLFVFVPQQHKH